MLKAGQDWNVLGGVSAAHRERLSVDQISTELKYNHVLFSRALFEPFADRQGFLVSEAWPMSGFENYRSELSDVDREILHYAALCGLDPKDTLALDRVSQDHQATGVRGTLRALLILRAKIESEMLSQGLLPPASDLPLPE